MADIPIIYTVVSEKADLLSRIEVGADILNVSCGLETPNVVKKIRQVLPDFPIIATGGPTEESIRRVIEAGANAISYTAPSNAELFKKKMEKYRTSSKD